MNYPHCGGACAQGRLPCNCNTGKTCHMETVISTQPTLLGRLRRWWRLRELRRQLHGANADMHESSARMDALESVQFTAASAQAKRIAFSRRELCRAEMLDCCRRIDRLNAEIKRLEEGGF